MSNKIVVGDTDWLRNDYEEDIRFGSNVYPSVEHAYQASKFVSDDLRTDIAEAESVREARKIGRNNPITTPNWDASKLTFMEILIREKFANENLAEQLVETGDAEIVMVNDRDTFWGRASLDDPGTGENHLGEILMRIRSEQQFLLGYQPKKCSGCCGVCDEPKIDIAGLSPADNDIVNSILNDLNVNLKLFVKIEEFTGVDALDVNRLAEAHGHREVFQKYVDTFRSLQNGIAELKARLGFVPEEEEEEEEEDWANEPMD